MRTWPPQSVFRLLDLVTGSATHSGREGRWRREDDVPRFVNRERNYHVRRTDSSFGEQISVTCPNVKQQGGQSVVTRLGAESAGLQVFRMQSSER
ncbi:unnamed protein product [Cuscuta epithymum]|uniref:Uncharacterized protein n=1 Tax=Cuscuta epithymum TaxID=186058 RepID=A0AAV0DBD0_9ASTE|nr:unnamed protein product [Cuscuta epithymum]CAH9099583.1 unnamed protein product [Cuscuta epithymum]